MATTRSLPKIAVIVVGYKSRDYLDECFESILASRNANFSVFFIDNDSGDGSIEFTQEKYPKVTTLQAGENLGFAEANNRMVEKIMKEDASFDAFFLLNPDTVTHPDCLAELCQHFNENTVLQPLILLHENGKKTEKVNSWGNPLHFLGFSYAGGNNKSMAELNEAPESMKIATASGAAVLIPTALIKKLGLFDARLFMYFEDTDFSVRARTAGAEILCVKNSHVWHKYVFSRNGKKFYLAERNRLLLILKNFQLKTIIVILPMLIVTDLFMVLFAAMNGWAGSKIKATWDALRMAPGFMKSRSHNKKLRTIPDKKMYSLITSKLSFSEIESAPIRLYNLFASIYWSVAKLF